MKKEITFDFAKWGQEGISVIDKDNNIDVCTLHKSPFVLNTYYGLLDNESTYHLSVTDLTMFEEVKPREFWVNVTGKGDIYIYKDFASADSQCGDWTTETIKVREVLE